MSTILVILSLLCLPQVSFTLRTKRQRSSNNNFKSGMLLCHFDGKTINQREYNFGHIHPVFVVPTNDEMPEKMELVPILVDHFLRQLPPPSTLAPLCHANCPLQCQTLRNYPILLSPEAPPLPLVTASQPPADTKIKGQPNNSHTPHDLNVDLPVQGDEGLFTQLWNALGRFSLDIGPQRYESMSIPTRPSFPRPGGTMRPIPPLQHAKPVKGPSPGIPNRPIVSFSNRPRVPLSRPPPSRPLALPIGSFKPTSPLPRRPLSIRRPHHPLATKRPFPLLSRPPNTKGPHGPKHRPTISHKTERPHRLPVKRPISRPLAKPHRPLATNRPHNHPHRPHRRPRNRTSGVYHPSRPLKKP